MGYSPWGSKEKDRDGHTHRNVTRTHTHTHTHTHGMSWIELEITWIEREIIRLSELSHTEKDKYNMISLVCGIFFKKYT